MSLLLSSDIISDAIFLTFQISSMLSLQKVGLPVVTRMKMEPSSCGLSFLFYFYFLTLELSIFLDFAGPITLEVYWLDKCKKSYRQKSYKSA